MKISITILIICSFMFTVKSHSQVTSNKFEAEFEKGVEHENPEYYNGLKTILKEFQKHLISKGIIASSNYKSYAGLLDKIRADKERNMRLNLILAILCKSLRKDLTMKVLLLKVL